MTPFGAARVVRGLPVRRRQPPDPRLELRVRRPAVDFPRYAAVHLDGRLPVDRLIDRRIALDDLEDAFDRLRAGEGLRQVIVFD